MQNQTLYWIDGKIVAEAPKISCMDLGVTRGYGVFDFFRTYKKIPFYLEEHLSRFYSSAYQADLLVPYSKEEIIAGINELICNHSSEDIGIRLYLTAGSSSHIFFPESNPSFWMVATKISNINISSVRLKTIYVQRDLPSIKSLNYMAAIISARKFSKEGFDDIVYMNDKNELLESSTSNLFFIKNNRLITANENILEGITRSIILEIAKGNFEIELRSITLSELCDVDECFITSTTKEICSVSRIDNIEFKNTQTKFLQSLFRIHVDNFCSIKI